MVASGVWSDCAVLSVLCPAAECRRRSGLGDCSSFFAFCACTTWGVGALLGEGVFVYSRALGGVNQPLIASRSRGLVLGPQGARGQADFANGQRLAGASI